MTDEARRAEFIRAFGECKTELQKRTLAAFLDGMENAGPAAKKKDAFRANARRSRFRKSDRPAQQSPKRKKP